MSEGILAAAVLSVASLRKLAASGSEARLNLILQLSDAGYSRREVAGLLEISASSVTRAIAKARPAPPTVEIGPWVPAVFHSEYRRIAREKDEHEAAEAARQFKRNATATVANAGQQP